MRAAWLVLLLLPAASAGFGEGPIAFREYVVDGAEDVAEPTLGIPWNTDSLFFHSGITTIKGVFDGDNVTWTDVTPPYQVPINLDPLLVADEDTGRVFAGGLHGACSIMMYSDDDGNTWLPSMNMCSGAQFDHQSLGVGPKPIVGNPLGLPQLNNAYYCGQLLLIGCSVSIDGGVTWSAPSPAAGQAVDTSSDQTGICQGFHGHWRVSRVTGTAVLPVAACGDNHGLLVANVLVDGTQIGGITGLTFEGRTVAGSHTWNGGFDSSIGFGRGEGWMYYGQADAAGARIGLSKDEGLTWEGLPSPDGDTTWLDVGQFIDPPVVKATFADVQAGDDDRVAFTFLGLEDLDGDGKGDEYPDLYGCEPPNEGPENRVWHYYAAFSYDAGQTWDVSKLTDHPVQIGGIWDGGGGNPCRNLLDFNDMDIDSMGRVHIGWSDGCLEICFDPSTGEHIYTKEPRVLRQVGGNGLFAAFDLAPPAQPIQDTDGDGISDDQDDDIDGDGIANEDDVDPTRPNGPQPDTEEASGFPVVALVAALGAVLLLRRRC
ncbi:MAG: hypothetical protein ACPHID_07020 [Thermoplasmatota archaeon]